MPLNDKSCPLPFQFQACKSEGSRRTTLFPSPAPGYINSRLGGCWSASHSRDLWPPSYQNRKTDFTPVLCRLISCWKQVRRPWPSSLNWPPTSRGQAKRNALPTFLLHKISRCLSSPGWQMFSRAMQSNHPRRANKGYRATVLGKMRNARQSLVPILNAGAGEGFHWMVKGLGHWPMVALGTWGRTGLLSQFWCLGGWHLHPTPWFGETLLSASKFPACFHLLRHHKSLEAMGGG